MTKSAVASAQKQKIDALFIYRQLPALLAQADIKSKSTFSRRLKILQNAIYDLDHYLESNWDLKKKEINIHWKLIFNVLKEFGYNRSEAEDLCKHIYKYQSHELGLRSGKSPLRYTIKYLYYYKSCDVKLMRKLIYLQDPGLNKIVSESDWYYFDMITELNDDISDIYEDLNTYNCNRFLASLIKVGPKATGKEYKKYMNELLAKASAKARKNKKNKPLQELMKETRIAIQETKELLDKKISQKKITTVSKAMIADFI